MMRRSHRKGGWLGNRRFNAIPEDEIALKTTQRNKQRNKDTPPGRWKRLDPSQGEEEEGGESTSPLQHTQTPLIKNDKSLPDVGLARLHLGSSGGLAIGSPPREPRRGRSYTRVKTPSARWSEEDWLVGERESLHLWEHCDKARTNFCNPSGEKLRKSAFFNKGKLAEESPFGGAPEDLRKVTESPVIFPRIGTGSTVPSDGFPRTARLSRDIEQLQELKASMINVER